MSPLGLFLSYLFLPVRYSVGISSACATGQRPVWQHPKEPFWPAFVPQGLAGPPQHSMHSFTPCCPLARPSVCRMWMLAPHVVAFAT